MHFDSRVRTTMDANRKFGQNNRIPPLGNGQMHQYLSRWAGLVLVHVSHIGVQVQRSEDNINADRFIFSRVSDSIPCVPLALKHSCT